MPSIYLAGPEVFLTEAVEIGRRKRELCAAYGFEGLYPLDNETRPAEGVPLDKLIYDANKAMIARADLGICNLTPFRGPGADAGTVFELGFMVALGKRVYAYTNDAASYASRVDRFDPGAGRTLRDRDGLAVEDFGNFDNLMLEWAVRESSGHPTVRHAARPEQRYHDLAAFEQCLRLASASPPATVPTGR